MYFHSLHMHMMSKLQYGRKVSGTPHYQTFPTKPPSVRGQPLGHDTSSPSSPQSGNSRSSRSLSPHSCDRIGVHEDEDEKAPTPFKQLGVLAIISLAEQTALNSISPYLPRMAASFPEVARDQIGLYVGIIASSYALAQALCELAQL